MLDVAIAQHPNPDQRLLLDRLRTMNERSIETAEALLALAQIETTTIANEPIDLATIAADVVNFCAVEAREHGVVLTLALEPAVMEGEPVLLRQLITNLVQNGIRHNLSANGFLTVATRSSVPDGSASIEVENSGSVIDQRTASALTEPFARAGGRPSSSAKRGHGLGLSIVAAISERFHGTLSIQPRADGGLRVTASFPQTGSSAAQASADDIRPT